MTGLTVTTDGLTLRYGRDTAVDDVSLDLGAGRIHGLLGRNGAGKTTLLSALASLRSPSAGSIRIDGQEPFENRSVMERVCLIRESGDVIPDEKLEVNLDFQEQTRPSFDRDYAEALVGAFGLDLKKKVQELSRGQASAFGVVVGLASRAPLTMFDEVHLGMDAPSRQRFYDELLADFAENPRTIVISSHLIGEIETMLETVTILSHGRLLLHGEADDVRAGGVTLTGPSAEVDAVVDGRAVVGRRDLGPTRQVTMFGGLDPAALRQAEQAGVAVGAVPLQDLFIHLTQEES